MRYTSPGPALPCPALPCPALPCPALPCPALPYPAQRRIVIGCTHTHMHAHILYTIHVMIDAGCWMLDAKIQSYGHAMDTDLGVAQLSPEENYLLD